MADAPTYTAEQVDAAVAALSEPGRLDHAQEVVTHAAPALQKILNDALFDGGYFSGAHESAVAQAAATDDPEQRVIAIRTLIAEEVRLGLLIGTSVGFQLAHELQNPQTPPQET
ncbi:hypothetical protein NBH00_18905 [Paraconexibacter antarcticus]|uniref:Uncharacterized protein n=1 Tax=Paraconexibacter antarcticus TaxID=2949664 RepID=A0ABY5DR50_9ACTN|nr:hypothetical protein [Paraconexibacter antarcticus]UTI63406.1 hypothetical protein NBH00_18905 [Paraconexibacter antarcticus]